MANKYLCDIKTGLKESSRLDWVKNKAVIQHVVSYHCPEIILYNLWLIYIDNFVLTIKNKSL